MIEEEGFTEKWIQIPDFPDYWISNEMRVLRLSRRKIVAFRSKNEIAHIYVDLYKNGKYFKRTLQSLMNKTFERIPRAIS